MSWTASESSVMGCYGILQAKVDCFFEIPKANHNQYRSNTRQHDRHRNPVICCPEVDSTKKPFMWVNHNLPEFPDFKLFGKAMFALSRMF